MAPDNPKSNQTYINCLRDKETRCHRTTYNKQRMPHAGQLSEQHLLTKRSFYGDTELQLQTDFKSDRKFVRVCVQEGKASAFLELLGK